MSYNISFKVRVDGTHLFVPVGECYANITWNAREIISKSTGLDWKNGQNNGPCIDIMPKIAYGYDELNTRGELYKQYENKNGWGTVEGTKRFFAQLLDAWGKLVNSHDELVPFVTFWIE